jgi:hypothetical protein
MRRPSRPFLAFAVENPAGWPGPNLKRITQEKHRGQPDGGSLGYLGSQDTFYVGNYLPRRREAFLLLEADVL